MVIAGRPKTEILMDALLDLAASLWKFVTGLGVREFAFTTGAGLSPYPLNNSPQNYI